MTISRESIPRVGVIGCGDVLHREYLPGLAKVADRVAITACCDADGERAARAARRWWGSVNAHDDIDEFLSREELDGVLNLTAGAVSIGGPTPETRSGTS